MLFWALISVAHAVHTHTEKNGKGENFFHIKFLVGAFYPSPIIFFHLPLYVLLSVASFLCYLRFARSTQRYSTSLVVERKLFEFWLLAFSLLLLPNKWKMFTSFDTFLLLFAVPSFLPAFYPIMANFCIFPCTLGVCVCLCVWVLKEFFLQLSPLYLLRLCVVQVWCHWNRYFICFNLKRISVVALQ